MTKSTEHQDVGARIIKKYANRRLYDAATSSYVSLAEVKDLVVSGEPCKIIDAKTEEDLTHSVLLQILLEEEINHKLLFTAPMLANIIRFYGHSMQGMMGKYLENIFQNALEMQKPVMGNLSGINIFDQFQKQIQKQSNDIQSQAQNMQAQVLVEMQQFFDLVSPKNR